MASLKKFFMIIKYVLDYDILLFLISIALEICSTMDVGWLELSLMYFGIVLGLLNGFY